MRLYSPRLGALAIANGDAGVEIMMLARLFYGMARRQQLPAVLGNVNPRTRTPDPGNWARWRHRACGGSAYSISGSTGFGQCFDAWNFLRSSMLRSGASSADSRPTRRFLLYRIGFHLFAAALAIGLILAELIA